MNNFMNRADMDRLSGYYKLFFPEETKIAEMLEEDREKKNTDKISDNIKQIIDIIKYVRDRKEPVEFSQECLIKDQEARTYGRRNACQEILILINDLQKKGKVPYIGDIL